MFASPLRPAARTTAMETGEPVHQIELFNYVTYVFLTINCERGVVNIFKPIFYDFAFMINLVLIYCRNNLL
jgi:hypothetical protein